MKRTNECLVILSHNNLENLLSILSDLKDKNPRPRQVLIYASGYDNVEVIESLTGYIIHPLPDTSEWREQALRMARSSSLYPKMRFID